MENVPHVASAIGDVVAADVAAATSAVARRAAYLARLLGWDESLLLGVRRFHAPWRTRIARSLTRAGDGRSWVITGSVLMAAGALARSRTIVHLSIRLGVAATLGALASQGLKRSLTRRRPTKAIQGFTALADDPDAFSFPSGHTSAAFAVAIAVQGEARCAGPLSLLFATGVALSRVYLGAHYPLDVAAGALLGSATGIAVRVVVP